MKIVLNKSDVAPFRVSQEFCDYYGIKYKLKTEYGIIPIVWLKEPLQRWDKRLVEYIERFGSERASGFLAELEIVEIPPHTKYEIINYGSVCERIYVRDMFDIWQ